MKVFLVESWESGSALSVSKFLRRQNHHLCRDGHDQLVLGVEDLHGGAGLGPSAGHLFGLVGNQAIL